MIQISEELKNLAQIFKKYNIPLYIVGGYVRDSLLKIKNSHREDIDICSSATPDMLEKILNDTEFEISELSKKFGVMEIKGANASYEHATFRRDVYSDNSHIPTDITFVKSLREDAERRDFKINAIYYDILNNKYIDPLGGVKDLKMNIITTVKAPKLVLQDDPERILRLIRISNVLGFSIGEDELALAKENAYKIQGLSKRRVRYEFNKILMADKFYPELKKSNNAHINAFKMLEDFGILKIILPAFSELEGENMMTANAEKIHKHFKMVEPALRLPIIFIDILNAKKAVSGKNFDDKEYIKELINKNLGESGLNYPQDVISKIKNIVTGFDFTKKFLMSKKDIRSYVFYHSNAITEIVELKNLFPPENETEKEREKRIEFIELIQETYKEMLLQDVVFDKTKIKLTGEDIINNFPRIKLDKLEDLKLDVAAKLAETAGENVKENLIALANKVINSKQDYYLEK